MLILFFYKNEQPTFKHEILMPQFYNYGKRFVYKYSPCIICEKNKKFSNIYLWKIKIEFSDAQVEIFCSLFWV